MMAVIVTGFGPFGEHTTNVSWEAVKALPSMWQLPQKLHVEEVPVEYKFVCEQVPGKWADLQPLFTVHVGVSNRDQRITLERVAHNDGYCKDDVSKCCPSGNICVQEGPGELSTTFDLDRVVEGACLANREAALGLDFEVSSDAGRYLCDFVYYKSLHGLGGKSLFIHVPPKEKAYSVNQLTRGIYLVIQELLKQL